MLKNSGYASHTFAFITLKRYAFLIHIFGNHNGGFTF